MNWAEFFYYDESSPSGLRWKVDRYTGRYYKVLAVSAGDVAGNLSETGHWNVKLDGRQYKVHRIIFELVNETDLLDGEQIDHIDRNRGNNKVSNLRRVIHIVNMRNKNKQSNNTSGITGVAREERKQQLSGQQNGLNLTEKNARDPFLCLSTERKALRS